MRGSIRSSTTKSGRRWRTTSSAWRPSYATHTPNPARSEVEPHQVDGLAVVVDDEDVAQSPRTTRSTVK